MLEGQIINEPYHTEAGLVSSGSPTDSPRPVASKVSCGFFAGTASMDNKDILVPENNPFEASLEFSATFCTCPQDASCHSESDTTSATSFMVLSLTIAEGVSWMTAS